MSSSNASRSSFISVSYDGPADGREQAADVCIADFEQWFQASLKNGPLSPSEWAILKTFLYYATLPQSGG